MATFIKFQMVEPYDDPILVNIDWVRAVTPDIHGEPTLTSLHLIDYKDEICDRTGPVEEVDTIAVEGTFAEICQKIQEALGGAEVIEKKYITDTYIRKLCEHVQDCLEEELLGGVEWPDN